MYGLVQFCEVLTAFSSSNELLLQKTASSSSLQFQQFLRSSLQFPAQFREVPQFRAVPAQFRCRVGVVVCVQ